MRKGLVWSIAVVLLTLASCGSPSFFSRCAPVERQGHGVESLNGAADYNNHSNDWSAADHAASNLVLLHRGSGFVPHCSGRGGRSGTGVTVPRSLAAKPPHHPGPIETLGLGS